MTDKTLNEGKWLSKIKDLINPKPIPTYTVELTCYPPFKEEPVVWKIDNVYDLDDERIQRAYESIRRQHPKSPIRLRSPLGNKTFYENSSSEYQLKVYDKEDGRIDTFGAGTLPQAMAMCEKLWNANPDSYKNIEVIHNNDVVTNYNGLEEGFTMNLNAAPDPNNNNDNNNKNQDQNQQNQVPQVNPEDPITTIKDQNGNDVNVSMSQDAETISIDGQPIQKNVFDQAFENLKKQVDELKNKPQDDQEQDQQNPEEQEQPENQDQTTEKPTENDQAEQPSDQPNDQASDQASDQANQEQDSAEQEKSTEEKPQDQTTQEQQSSDNNTTTEDDDLSKYDVYDPDYDSMRNQLGSKGKTAVDTGLKQFDKQAERDKRDADLEAEREKATERKSYRDNGGQSFFNKLLNNPVTKNLAAAGLTGLTGGAIAPMFAKGVTDHGIDRINNYNKETERINKANKEFDQKAEKNKKLDKAEDDRIKRRKELEKQLTNKYSSAVGYRRQDDIEKQAQARAVQAAATKAAKDAYAKKNKTTSKAQQFNQKAKEAMRNAANKNRKHESINEAELEHSWVDRRNDIGNINEFLELARNGIHPSLADARRPKFHNIFANRDADKYTEIDGQPAEIMVVLDGVEQIKHPTTGEPVNVAVIKEKVPVSINPETGSFTYRDGERHEITFNQFKKLINAPENAEIISKFNKSHPDNPELVLELYKQAKENMDDMYPSWENAYWDEYDLQNYDPIERSKIYLRWKEAREDRAYEDGHELTADEVRKEFALPKLQKKLEELGSLTGRLDQQAINNLLKQLPENKADELLDKVNEVLEDSYELNLIDTEKKIGEFMSTTPALLACENIIDKLTNGALQKLENNIPEDKKDEFESKKVALLDKYIKKVILHGVTRAVTDPKILSRKAEIIKDVEDLRKEYNISKWGMDIKQVKQNHEPSYKQFDDMKPEYSYDPEEVEHVKRELDALKTNNYQLKSEIEKLEYQFENGLISKEDVFAKMKELTNPKDSSWEDTVNASFSNNNTDAKNGIGILDRIDRSLKAYKDVDTNGMRISGKYHKLFDDILDQLKTQYPEGNEEELGEVIKTWYNNTLKPEIKKDTSVDQKLKNYVVTDQIGDSSEE